jgi:hypothetical protein
MIKDIILLYFTYFFMARSIFMELFEYILIFEKFLASEAQSKTSIWSKC